MSAAGFRAPEASDGTCPVHEPGASLTIPLLSPSRATAMALDLDALTLVTCLHLLEIGRVAVQLAQQQCPLDPQAAEEPLLPVAHLDGRGAGQAHQH